MSPDRLERMEPYGGCRTGAAVSPLALPAQPARRSGGGPPPGAVLGPHGTRTVPAGEAATGTAASHPIPPTPKMPAGPALRRGGRVRGFAARHRRAAAA